MKLFKRILALALVAAFALAFVASKNIESSIDAVAVGKTKLLLLSYQKCYLYIAVPCVLRPCLQF